MKNKKQKSIQSPRFAAGMKSKRFCTKPSFYDKGKKSSGFSIMNTRGHFALAQITLLILGIIAVGWAIGSEARVVSGAVNFATNPTNTPGLTPDQIQKMMEDGKKNFQFKNLDLDPVQGQAGVYTRQNYGGTYTIDSKGNLFWSGGKTPSGQTLSPRTLSNGKDGLISENWDASKNKLLSVDSTPPTLAQGLKFQQQDGTWADIYLDKAGNQYLKTGEDTYSKLVTSKDGGAVNYEGYWIGTGKGFLGNLWEGVQWAGMVVMAIQLVGRVAGMKENMVNTLSAAAFGGIMAGKGFVGAIEQWADNGLWGNEKFITDSTSTWGGLFKGTTNAQVYGTAIGIAVAVIIFYMMYKEEETETVSFTCEPWQAPTGGSKCEECNKQSGGLLPCSEYQCRSLGQSCQLVNKGTTDENCVWVNRKDVTPPVIRLWSDALSKNHKYNPDTSVSPPDVGTKIIYSGSSDGCIKAFTPLEFGILTDEPASCKLDYLRTQSFDNMSYYLGGTPAFLYNHSQVMSLPGSANLLAENISIKNNGEYSLYIRCQDSNGNTNTGTFVFRFCVDKSADTTPPLIVATNLLNNMPISYNKSSIDFEAYTNEPATCKWSHLDQAYDKMETKMTCSSSVMEMNAQMVYKCKTTLGGIKDDMENNFYIKCEDQPMKPESDRNRNTESYKFTIVGTKPLVITYVEPNGTIKDATDTVKVTLGIKTLGGYQEGNSTCYYSPTQVVSDYVAFFNTDSYTHTQDLWLPEGDYTYYLRCVDLGGNVDTNSTTFRVETDNEGPLVVRAYNEESNLKIITDEPSECVYGISDCVYDIKDGMKMSSIDANKTQHYTSWDTSKTFYIKCQDKYGNQPYPNQCSITLRPEQEKLVEED